MGKMIVVVIMTCIVTNIYGQQADSLFTGRDSSSSPSKIYFTNTLKKISNRKGIIRPIIIPGVLITYGVFSLGNNGCRTINEKVQKEIWSDHPHSITSIDNYLQFAPAVSVYALNAAGIKGKNNFRDRSMIFLLSNLILNSAVYPLKRITHRLRPDGSAYTSFPSGHTTEAFASAEFMYQEYKNVSPWYGVAGYVMAATTGYLRMYNNKHWLGDVVAGAGIGILSTKVAYWLEPIIAKKIFHKRSASHFDTANL